MGSPVENSAANVAAPEEGKIRVLALTTSASAEQDLTDLMSGDASANNKMRPRYFTFICAGKFYITFGTSTVTDPDETTASGNGRTWEVPADQQFHVRVNNGTCKFKAKAASGTPKLRWYPSDGPF